MAQAIAEGDKTQTRRIHKGHPTCPYGRPGDLLWVKESWQYDDWTEDGDPYIHYSDGCVRLIEGYPEEWSERLQEIWAELSRPENYEIDGRAADRKWRNPLFMPKWASRSWLKITAVRQERLQGISEEDAEAEGFSLSETFAPLTMQYRRAMARDAFKDKWHELYGDAPNKRWEANPWVWVISFERVEANAL
jgi:hypothetical protein